MQKPDLPPDEVERLVALHALKILDTPPEQLYDRITRLVAKLLDVPIVLVSFIDKDRQWFKSHHGLDVKETPRDISFCAHALHSSEPYVVEDARADPRFVDNPLVTGSPNIRFYAGMPLKSADDHILGTLCCIDTQPRRLSAEELALLRDLADTVEELLQQRQTAELTQDLLQVSQSREERYRNLIERSPDAFLIHTDGRICFINQAGMHLLGADQPQQVMGKLMATILAPEHQSVTLGAANAGQQNKHVMLTEQVWQRLDGTRVVVETFMVPFVFSGSKGVQVVARDITARKHEQQELERLSTRDMLTGLPNRALLMDRLQSSIASWQRHGQKGVVAVFDIDHFKEINDTLGQSAGDQVLVALGKNLASHISESDTIARISGDVFVLVLENEDDVQPSEYIRRLFELVSQPFMVATQQITVTCSVGYCCYPEDGDSAETLLSAAQTAVYRAKEVGRANVQVFRKEMRNGVNERFFMESQLRQAIERQQLELHYQPKVRLDDGHIVGVEALVRWLHPDQGLISPMRFIPLAEETGLIVPMGEWITHEACGQIRRWHDDHIKNMSIAINLSSKQFLQPDIVQCVQQAVQTAGIDPSCLEFELTESLAMGNPEKSISIMNALKALGVSLSVDDFGTGYSNLSHLIRFPVDKIKIDQSFIRNMMESAEARAIVKAIIHMGQTLHLTVVAEGVETEEELALLAEQGCHEIQGFYFSKPLPAAQCSDFILSAPGLGWLQAGSQPPS